MDRSDTTVTPTRWNSPRFCLAWLGLIACSIGGAAVWKAGVAPAAPGARTALTPAGLASSASAASEHRPIEQIRVGQRVVTDGGIANSPGGHTRAADPYATRVDPSTWRLLKVNVRDWHVQTLQPQSWIAEKHLASGRAIPLEQIIDVAEMGAPAGLLGTVDEITPCPPVQSGPGRVVLTTVSHLNDDVYDLTLKDASGVSERLGVTGSHRFYDTHSGWTHVNNLQTGERLRGNCGELTVVSAVREASAERVYNMTVETDHVYYVGELAALTHNDCHGTLTNPPSRQLYINFSIALGIFENGASRRIY